VNDMIERLRGMRSKGLTAKTRDEYTAAGESFIRASDEIIETIRALTSERDFLRAKHDALRARIGKSMHITVGTSGLSDAELHYLFVRFVALLGLEDGE
jgi:uncharacterized coiled-coil DUF342 family protein